MLSIGKNDNIYVCYMLCDVLWVQNLMIIYINKTKDQEICLPKTFFIYFIVL